ncbi:MULTISPECIES: hypothetical protein [Hymenobacter]|uniref:Uncharacterized protein n=2 Tax=Hymenobacter TaxID=89966 RepID=A0ABS6WXU5_9BACT|nr:MULTISPECIES: hypothetical protein [Hymenobacter]MBO3270452.1 hypothetical protein [Hymenobacter defluvii]MBW3128420.1 hypothetical protein [Hymenobacter profundi]QNE39828.1 hypothetical protein F1C16_09800 [Hymenobacter sp. NBH84]
MTTTEKFLYYAASLIVIVVVGLRLFHLLDPGWGMIAILLCSILTNRVYAQYAGRLAQRNIELEEQLTQHQQL